MSILTAFNPVNLVNTVNSVKELPPSGGLAPAASEKSADGGRGSDQTTALPTIEPVDFDRADTITVSPSLRKVGFPVTTSLEPASRFLADSELLFGFDLAIRSLFL